MFADMQNVEELACVGMQGLGTSRSEDSKSPEFQNLKARRGLACIHWGSLRVSWALLVPLGIVWMLGPRS